MRGIFLVLTIVAATALGVSFFSSFKAQHGQRKLQTLQSDIQILEQENGLLEKKLTDLQEKYAQETNLTKTLREALVREEARNSRLMEELQRHQKTTQDAKITKNENQTHTSNRTTSTIKDLTTPKGPTTNFSPNKNR